MTKTAQSTLAMHSNDVGSSSVQVESLTNDIKHLTEHLKVRPKDKMARRGLLQKVGRRRRLLEYLARTDEVKYLQTIKHLGLRK